MKKTLLLIFLSIFSFSAIHADVTWELKDGTLTIEGIGDMTMPDYDTFDDIPWYSQRSAIKNVVIKKGVKNIGENGFVGLENLSSVTIPNSVTSIGESAFYGCYALTSISIPESVTSIGSYAFSNCYYLTSITMPMSLTSIEDYTFYACGLTSITIPESVTSIGNYAFYGGSFSSITIPNTVTSIGEYAFGECSSLISVTIPNSVTTIEKEAFSECSSLNDITIFVNNNLKIAGLILDGCENLQDIILFGETLPKATGDLGITYNKVWLAVPEELQSKLYKTYPWGKFPAKNIYNSVYLTDDKEHTGDTYKNGVAACYTRDFQNTEWQALYLPFSIKPERLKDDFDVAYINGIRQFDTDDDGQIDETWMDVIKIKEGETYPNYPYVIRAKSTGKKNLFSSDYSIYPAYELGISCSTTTTKYTFTGTYRNISADDIYENDYYGMSNGELVLGDGVHGLKPYRWYMNVDFGGSAFMSGEITRAKSIKINVVDEESETTGIKEVQKSPVKDSSVYDLNGRKVNEKSLKSGLYIKNGKKFIIK